MIKSLSITALVGLTGLFLVTNDSEEPRLKYDLVVNGVSHELVLGRPIQIEGEFKDPTVELKAASTRLFPYGDVEFQYPAAFGWEAELDGPHDRVWTLTGNDLTIMYFVMGEEVDSASFLMFMGQQLGDEDPDVEECQRTLGGTAYAGHRVGIDMGEFSLHSEAFAFPSKEGTRLMVFQDSSDEGYFASDETKGAMELLSKTFIDQLGPDMSEK